MVVSAPCKLVYNLRCRGYNLLVRVFPLIIQNFLVGNIVYVEHGIFRTHSLSIIHIGLVRFQKFFAVCGAIVIFPNFTRTKVALKTFHIIIPKIKPVRVEIKVHADHIFRTINAGVVISAADNLHTVAFAFIDKGIHICTVLIFFKPVIFAYSIYNMLHKIKSPKPIIA